ncbi:MAG: peptidoglycan-binding protein [Desulfobacterales bacterium]|jgi:hypothetical protein
MGIDFSKGMAHFGRLADVADESPKSVDLVVNRIAALGEDFTQSEVNGLFVPLPLEEPQKSKDVSRIKTIRNRLANLGYLPKDSGRPYLDQELGQAIRRFQQEADLVVDGWVGEQTWTALQELVSFENPSNLLRWFHGGQIKAALKRAIGLRLFVLGLVEHAPADHPADPSGGMEEFGRVWQALKLGPVTSQASISLEWVVRLFDQDGLIDRLSKARVPSTLEERQYIHGFILNVAKIELWLAGYKVKPTGYDLKPRPRGDHQADSDIWMISSTVTTYLRLKKNMQFYKALLSFWQDHEVKNDQVKMLTTDFMMTYPRFFQMIAKEIQTDAAMTPSEKQAEIERVLKKYPKQIPTIWDHVHRMGNRIWDGIRRVWGWLKSLTKSGVKKVITLGSNLSRLIYDYALGAYTVTSNVLKSFGAVIHSITNPVIDGSDLKHIVMYHDNDFDFRLAINLSANSKAVKNLVTKVRKQTRMFVFACRILSIVMSIMLAIIRSGMTGYTGLIFALVRSKKHLDGIKGLIKEYQLVFSG